MVLVDCWRSILYLLHVIMVKMATSSTQTTNQRWIIWWCYKCTLTAKKPGPSKQHRVDACRRLHASYFANVQKSDMVNLFSFLFFCHHVKFCEAVIKKFLFTKILLLCVCVFFLTVIAEAVWLREGESEWRRDVTKQLILYSRRHESRTAVCSGCPVKTWRGFTFSRATVLYIPFARPQSRSRNVEVVCKMK